jgi:hypothetical protein
VATNVKNGTVSFTSNSGSQFTALIDSTVSQMYLPPAICDQFQTQLGLTYDNNTNYYVIDNNTHQNLVSQNPSFTFSIGQTAYDNGQRVSIVFPYSAFDFQIGWPVYSSNVYYFPIRQATNQSQYTLGRAFLQQAHIIVDYGRSNFSVAQAVFPDTTASSRLVTINSGSNTSGGHKISAGAIAGIAVAAVAGIGLLILGLILLWRRKKHGGSKEKAAELEGASHSDYATKMHGVHEADGEQVMEMSSDQEIYKPGLAELASPPVIYEMEGDIGTPSHERRASPGDTGRTLTPQTASTNRGSTPFSPVSGQFSGYSSQPSPLREDHSPHSTNPSPARQENLLSAPRPLSPSQPSPLTDQFSHGQANDHLSQSQPSPLREEHPPH